MNDKLSHSSATSQPLSGAEYERFKAWWEAQDLGDRANFEREAVYRMTAWNGWLARSTRSEIGAKEAEWDSPLDHSRLKIGEPCYRCEKIISAPLSHLCDLNKRQSVVSASSLTEGGTAKMLEGLEDFVQEGCSARPEDKHHALQVIDWLRERISTPSSSAEPVAYAVRTKSDGSFFSEIAPVGYTMFNDRLAELKDQPWVKCGRAEIVPLYEAPVSATAIKGDTK